MSNVVEVIEGNSSPTLAQERVNDVAQWLGRHAIAAIGTVKDDGNESGQLDALWQNEADLVVAGAYGHTRFREWVLGGFTRTVLTRSRRCSFLTH